MVEARSTVEGGGELLATLLEQKFMSTPPFRGEEGNAYLLHDWRSLSILLFFCRASRARLLLRIVPRAVAFSILSYSKAINVPFDAGNDLKALIISQRMMFSF